MKRVRRTCLAVITALAMVLPVFNASAAVIEEQAEVIFYQNGTAIEQSNIAANAPVKAKVKVVSENAAQNQSFNLILAAYKSGKSELADVSFEKKEIYNVPDGIVAPTSKYFETGEVTMPEGGSVAVYVWKGNNLVPEGEGTGIVNKGTYCLSGIKIGSYKTAVDQIGKRILVNTTADITDAAVTDVKIPSGCTYQMTSGNAALVLTSPNGAVEYKVVKTDAFDYYDFNSEDVGALTTTSSKGVWFNHNSAANTSVEYAKDALDSNNTVIKLTDDNTSGKAQARFTLSQEKTYPYVVSYKVMYEARDNSSDDITYSHMHMYTGEVGGWKSFADGTAIVQNKEYKFAEGYANGVSTKASGEYFELKTWHEVSMAVVDANTVEYYFDGKFIGKLDVTGYTTSLNYIRFETNNGRTSVAYIDDIMIRDYYVEKADLYSASFKDASGSVVAGYMYDGKVYANAASLDGLSLDAYSVSDGASAVLDNENSKITVTSADGKTQDYQVIAKTFFTDNFEGYTVGAELSNTDNYTVTPAADTSVLVAEDDSNKILCLTDNSASNYARTRIKLSDNTTAKSFVAEYRVRYRLNGAFNTTGNNPFYAYAGGNGGSYYAIQPLNGTEDAIKIGYSIQDTSDSTKDKNITSSKTIKLNEWHTIKIVYTTDGSTANVSYYMDGEALAENQTARVKNPFDYLELRTSGGRTCIVDYDDITILPLD